MKQFHDITVLTTNTVDNPVVYTFKIDKGVVSYIGVFYPPGCHGVVHAKVFFQAHQVLPRNQESWAHGNNGWWDEEAQIAVIDSPLQVKVVAYSAAAGYTHTITVCIELLPFSYTPQWDKVVAMLSSLMDVLEVEV